MFSIVFFIAIIVGHVKIFKESLYPKESKEKSKAKKSKTKKKDSV